MWMVLVLLQLWCPHLETCMVNPISPISPSYLSVGSPSLILFFFPPTAFMPCYILFIEAPPTFPITLHHLPHHTTPPSPSHYTTFPITLHHLPHHTTPPSPSHYTTFPITLHHLLHHTTPPSPSHTTPSSQPCM